MNLLNRLPEIFNLGPPTCPPFRSGFLDTFLRAAVQEQHIWEYFPQIYFCFTLSQTSAEPSWNHPKTPLKRRPFTLLTSSSPACWTGSICPWERWVWAARVSAAGGTGRRTGSPLLDWWEGRAGSVHWTSAAAGSLCWKRKRTNNVSINNRNRN